VEVREPAWIAEGAYTSGEVRGVVVEQSLVLVAEQSLAVITGCAHSGIVRIVERAREIVLSGDVADGDVHLIIGGFHLGRRRQAAIVGIVDDFQRLGVQKVAACHCSGDLPRSLFGSAHEENFIEVGVGSRLAVGG
jgi:7,8-dihydropterin-6-yl-methyl-4-(beta-D-ribofuranosyl)aminobenzene 5'-phosphate synthase